MINEDISCKSQRHDNALYIPSNIFIYSFISAKREGYDSTKIEEQIYYVEHFKGTYSIHMVYVHLNFFFLSRRIIFK